jgi:hypothetical protein
MGVFRQVRQFVNLLSGETFVFRGARIHNRTGKPVRLEVETDEYEIRKIRTEEPSSKRPDSEGQPNPQ